jgi:hypothetical protein
MKLKIIKIKNNHEHYSFSSGGANGWGNGFGRGFGGGEYAKGTGYGTSDFNSNEKLKQYKVRSTEHDNTKRRNKNSR